MPYSGVQGDTISFDGESSDAPAPKRRRSSSRAPKAPKQKKGPKPCGAGKERNPDTGRCRKIARPATGVEKAISRTIGIKTPKASSRTSVSEKIAVSAGGRLAQVGARRIAGKLSGDTLERFLNGSLLSGGAAMVAARLSVLAAAGLAAYAATTAVLNKIRDARERKQQQRFELAQAYRQTRLDLAASQGRALTAGEQALLSEQFKNAAREIGWNI